jgi:hypothetical protein
MGSAIAPAANTRDGFVIVALTLAVQFLLQAWFFPLGELLSAKRLLHIDAAYHQYMMEATASFCSHGRLVGYDPYFGAGTLSGVTPTLSTKLQGLTACVAGGG